MNTDHIKTTNPYIIFYIWVILTITVFVSEYTGYVMENNITKKCREHKVFIVDEVAYACKEIEE